MQGEAKIEINQDAIATRFATLFIDHPAPTGLSVFCDTTTGPAGTQEANAAQFVAAVKTILARHPQFSGRDIYLAGESYAGRFLPAIATEARSADPSGVLSSRFICYCSLVCTRRNSCHAAKTYLQSYPWKAAWRDSNIAVVHLAYTSHTPFFISIPLIVSRCVRYGCISQGNFDWQRGSGCCSRVRVIRTLHVRDRVSERATA